VRIYGAARIGRYGEEFQLPETPAGVMRRFQLALLVAGLTAACDDEPNLFFFQSPTDANLVGSWSGFEEITTAEDISGNVGSPADRGFQFPIALNMDGNGRFSLFTSGYPTSFDDPSDRTCSGIYTRTDSRSITFFPSESCRALPMTKFTIGRVAPSGITLEARSTAVNNPAASYLTMRVFIRLDRD